MDSQSTACKLPTPHLSHQLIHSNDCKKQTEKKTECGIGRTENTIGTASTTVLVESSIESSKIIENLRAELESKRSKIVLLENENRFLESKCASLEAEIMDFKATSGAMAIKLVHIIDEYSLK